MWLPPGLTKRSVVNRLQLYLQWRKFQEDKLAILGIYQLLRTKRIGMQLTYSSGAAARQDVRPCQLSLCSKDRGEIKDQASLFGKTCFCGIFYPLLALLLYLRLSPGKSHATQHYSFAFKGQLFKGSINRVHCYE